MLAAAAGVLAGAAMAATRPHYGGTLHVEVREPGEMPDPPESGHLAELSGDFQITRWEPGRRAVFAAAENAPGGRPFVDAVEIDLARPYRDQALDLELGKADLVEAGPAETRRFRRTWSSAPVRLVALVFGARIQDVRVREALALSVDRAAIHTVLLQRQGEISGGLLPQWLSGYAFLFPAAQDAARARTILNGITPASRSLSLGYDTNEPQSRAIAERIAVTARDVGLLVSVTPQWASADAWLAQVRLGSADPAVALAGVAAALNLGEPAKGSGIEALYAAERALLEGYRAVPLFYLPEVWGVGPRVRTWQVPAIDRDGAWRLGNVWLEKRP